MGVSMSTSESLRKLDQKREKKTLPMTNTTPHFNKNVDIIDISGSGG